MEQLHEPYQLPPARTGRGPSRSFGVRAGSLEPAAADHGATKGASEAWASLEANEKVMRMMAMIGYACARYDPRQEPTLEDSHIRFNTDHRLRWIHIHALCDL